MKEQKKRISFKQDSDNFFSIEHLKENLKTRSVRGGFVTLIAQIFKLVLTLASNIILGRLLTPEDYGLIGMVTSVIGFVSLFKDLGLSMAIIQKDDITHRQVSTLFWINIFIGLTITLLTIGTAPLIANFYNEPRLTFVTTALAIGILISALGTQHIALLNRQMRYIEIVLNDTLSMLAGTVMSIGGAISGLGYWSLVIMPIGMAITSTIGAWIVCDWRPGLPSRTSGVRSMLLFGSNLTGFSIVNYFARNLDNILIGKVWGAQELGLYSKGYQLLLLPLNQINAPIASVAIPSLSRLQNNPQKLRDYYLKAVSVITFATIPLTVILFTIAQPMIEVLLGNQWKETGEIFQLLSISAIFQTVCSTSGWIYIAMNRSRHMFRWGLVACSFIMLSFWVGLPYGPTGVASCYSAMMLLQTWPCLYFATRNTTITMKDIWNTVKHQIVSVIMSWLIYYIVRISIIHNWSSWSTIISCTFIIINVYLFIILVVLKKRNYYLSIVSAFKK